MSAQRAYQGAYQAVPEEQLETEVIYLVIPPSLAPSYAPKPYTLTETLAIFGMELRARLHSLSDSSLAAVGAVVVSGCLGYALYTFKSAAGIDLFPTQHIESFVPINGFNRW